MDSAQKNNLHFFTSMRQFPTFANIRRLHPLIHPDPNRERSVYDGTFRHQCLHIRNDLFRRNRRPPDIKSDTEQISKLIQYHLYVMNIFDENVQVS